MTRIPSHRQPTHPGEVLFEEFIKPLGVTQAELAEWIDVSYPRLNEIIHGKTLNPHRFADFLLCETDSERHHDTCSPATKSSAAFVAFIQMRQFPSRPDQ